jgi:hypothetical protein
MHNTTMYVMPCHAQCLNPCFSRLRLFQLRQSPILSFSLIAFRPAIGEAFVQSENVAVSIDISIAIAISSSSSISSSASSSVFTLATTRVTCRKVLANSQTSLVNS